MPTASKYSKNWLEEADEHIMDIGVLNIRRSTASEIRLSESSEPIIDRGKDHDTEPLALPIPERTLIPSILSIQDSSTLAIREIDTLNTSLNTQIDIAHPSNRQNQAVRRNEISAEFNEENII